MKNERASPIPLSPEKRGPDSDQDRLFRADSVFRPRCLEQWNRLRPASHVVDSFALSGRWPRPWDGVVTVAAPARARIRLQQSSRSCVSGWPESLDPRGIQRVRDGKHEVRSASSKLREAGKRAAHSFRHPLLE